MTPRGDADRFGGDALRRLHAQAEATFVSLEAFAADGAGAHAEAVPGAVPGAGAEVVETFGDVEGEYGAIRAGCALIDLPHRATLQVIGKDRSAFLNRMLTQDLSPRALPAFGTARSFWLNRRGRIEADVRVIALEDRWLVDVDARVAGATVETLSKFVFTEDVEVIDASARWRRLALHGPGARDRLARAAAPGDAAERIGRLEERHALAAPLRTRAGTVECVVDRQDSAGVCGLELLAPSEAAHAVWEALVESGGESAVRGIGWAAYDIARVEAGWPVFLLDFGRENLAHETGVLRDRVSFTKGCYLGQEIVARMESLGQPKQTLIGLRAEGAAAPVRGAPVFVEGEAEAIGAITSAATSPALGGVAVCFAMVKTKHASAGARLAIGEGAQRAGAIVQDRLRFLPE